MLSKIEASSGSKNFLIKCFLVIKTDYNKRGNKNFPSQCFLYNKKKALKCEFLWTEDENNLTKTSKAC